MFELHKSGGKKVCPPFHVRKSNCPMIVRGTSEDLLTSNVFGILKNLNPNVWLKGLLGEAIKGRDFSALSFENLSFQFWKKYRPPANRKYREGISEVDLTISYEGGVIFIEAKYLAPLSLRTTHDQRRDQVIRYLDLAVYHHLSHQQGGKEFFFILITDTERPPWAFTRYQLAQNISKGLTSLGLFKPSEGLGNLLSKRLGWISWHQLKRMLETTRQEFRTGVEKAFVDDLIVYLNYKIREAERTRNERKQLNLW